MNLLFKSRQRSPSELGRGLRELCMRLGASVAADGTWYLADVPLGGEGRRKVHEEIWQALQQAKLVLYGEGGTWPYSRKIVIPFRSRLRSWPKKCTSSSSCHAC